MALIIYILYITNTKPGTTVQQIGRAEGNIWGHKDDGRRVGDSCLSSPPDREDSHTTLPAKIQTSNEFKDSFNHMFESFPGETRMNQLLRPIEGTGKEKLRETGIRARAFKTVFEAWEKFHLAATTDKKEDYIRDKIIQKLLQNTPTKNIAKRIHQYGKYHKFIQSLASLLFPYISPAIAGDTNLHTLMSLHTQIYTGGRGIVLSAGNRQAPYLLTSIPVLRMLGCNLPIEIMYVGDNDLNKSYRSKFELLEGVATRNLAGMINAQGWVLGGWGAKPFAILMSSFREVIFIDADSLFFKNPERLFDDESYKTTGALFFKDRILYPQDKKDWLEQIMPTISDTTRQSRFWTGLSAHMQESGVIVVDKWRHFVALLFVTRMNGPDRDGDKAKGTIGVYDMVYGDKETFWVGWELVGDTEYAFHQGDAGVMGQLKGQNETKTATGELEMCAPQLLHLDLDGTPLWFNGWVLVNKFETNPEKQQVNVFHNYLREDSTLDANDNQWVVKQNNTCCLTASKSFSFTPEETGTLEMILKLASSRA
ncbi:hypothetical protein ABW20_dc0109486 [Dactylellina cionopaga]|nr:hypothetical protein ABW20_dc0109486 [Dactylellina cionopaga]